MSLTDLTTADIAKITKLLERKEALQNEVAAIDEQLMAIEKGQKAPAASTNGHITRSGSTRASGRGRRRNARGSVKEQIIALLQSAGKQGISIKELAESLNTKYGNVSVWFQSTGKRIPQVKRVAPARYAWIE